MALGTEGTPVTTLSTYVFSFVSWAIGVAFLSSKNRIATAKRKGLEITPKGTLVKRKICKLFSRFGFVGSFSHMNLTMSLYSS